MSTSPGVAGPSALHAEWTKLRTVSSTLWTAMSAVALAVAVGITAVAAANCPASGCDGDPAKISLTGVTLGQAAIVILAVFAVGGEYSTGVIHLSLVAVPRRGTLLAAKAVAVTTIALVAGTIAVPASILAGRLILPSRGFIPDHGYPPLSMMDAPVLRAAAGSVLYLGLIALFSVGIATAVRDSAIAAAAVLGLLYLFPLAAALVADPAWSRRLQQIGPMSAGLAIQATTGLRRLPIAPWNGLAVLAAWTAAALLTGAVLLQRRDS